MEIARALSHGRLFMDSEIKIVNIRELDVKLLDMMLDEYAANGEECKPMKFYSDKNTKMYAIIVGEEPAGIVRVTRILWRKCHGNVGISVRPSRRGMGIGSVAIRDIDIGAMNEPTACIDEKNKMSIKMFESAGWVRTGETYEWPGGRLAIEYVKR